MIRVLSLLLATLLFSVPAVFAEEKGAYTEVPNDKVCMVNDKFMAEDQIPVPFEGKTYYGCCEMCVTKLQGDVTARTAIDPHTGKSVDKASAYIVMKPDKTVLYFTSKDTFVEYSKNSVGEIN